MATLPLSGTPLAAAASPDGLQDWGAAPDFHRAAHWFNSPALLLAGIGVRVVLIDFWTFGCSNCLRTLPQVSHWAQTCLEQGLVVGEHTGVRLRAIGLERAGGNRAPRA